MNEYVTGAIIKELREKYHLTQAELAEKINVSDKTVSKWETAKGILFYCNQDGLFSINIVKGIDDKVTSYLVLWEPKTESRKIIIF